MYMSLVQKDDVSARHIPPRAEFSVLETAWLGWYQIIVYHDSMYLITWEINLFIIIIIIIIQKAKRGVVK